MLGVSQKSADYKTIFFRKGAHSVAKLWFDDGCKISMEEKEQAITESLQDVEVEYTTFGKRLRHIRKKHNAGGMFSGCGRVR